MITTNHVEVRSEIRNSSAGPLADRRALSETIDHALKSNRFCEPERSLIVQIVCDALAETQKASPEPARMAG